MREQKVLVRMKVRGNPPKKVLYHKKKVWEIIDGGIRYRITIEAEIKEWEGIHWKTMKKTTGHALSISGNIVETDAKTNKKIDESSGELYDDIPYGHHADLDHLVELWKEWHLNAFIAGTPEQESAIKEWKKKHGRYNYDDLVKHLKEKGIYEINGYKYGHKWLFRPLPKNIEEKIEKIMG